MRLPVPAETYTAECVFISDPPKSGATWLHVPVVDAEENRTDASMCKCGHAIMEHYDPNGGCAACGCTEHEFPRSQAAKAAEVLQRWVLMGRQCVQCQAPNDNPDKGAHFCLACTPNPYVPPAFVDAVRKEYPQHAPRRFATPGRKWLAPVECSLQWERVHGERMPILTGAAESSAAAYVHPRSLKGRVNVAALAVDDPNGDDVS